MVLPPTGSAVCVVFAKFHWQKPCHHGFSLQLLYYHPNSCPTHNMGSQDVKPAPEILVYLWILNHLVVGIPTFDPQKYPGNYGDHLRFQRCTLPIGW